MKLVGRHELCGRTKYLVLDSAWQGVGLVDIPTPRSMTYGMAGRGSGGLQGGMEEYKKVMG